MSEVRKCAAAAALATFLAACAGTGVRQQASTGALYDPVRVEYNAATDSTRVRTAVLPVTPTLSMYAGFRFPGEILTARPGEVRLVFQESSPVARWESPRRRSLELVLDDTARVRIDTTQYMRHVDAGRGPLTAKVTEWVWAGVPLDTFERIAGARRVDVVLGATRFALKAEHLDALRQLARRVAPTGAPAAPAASPSGAAGLAAPAAR